MIESGQGVSVRVMRAIARVLARMGEDPEEFLDSLGVLDGASDDAFASGERADRALARLAARRGDPALSLTLARAAMGQSLGFFEHLVWLSPTLRVALVRAVGFYRLVSERVTIRLDVDGGLATLTQSARPGAHHGAMLTEFAYASLVLRAREAIGRRFDVRAMSFAHATTDDRPYVELFGAPVTFDAPVVQLVFDGTSLDAPLAKGDATTSAALEAYAARTQSTGSAASFLASRYQLNRRDALLALRVCSGMRNREIAREMRLTEGTVKQYLSRIYAALGVRHRSELAALIHGLPERPDPLEFSSRS